MYKYKFYLITKKINGDEFEEPVYTYDRFSYVTEGILAGNRILNALSPSDLENLEYALLCDSNKHRDVVYEYEWVTRQHERIYHKKYPNNIVIDVGDYIRHCNFDGIYFCENDIDEPECMTPEYFADTEIENMIDDYGICPVSPKQLDEIREILRSYCESMVIVR